MTPQAVLHCCTAAVYLTQQLIHSDPLFFVYLAAAMFGGTMCFVVDAVVPLFVSFLVWFLFTASLPGDDHPWSSTALSPPPPPAAVVKLLNSEDF